MKQISTIIRKPLYIRKPYARYYSSSPKIPVIDLNDIPFPLKSSPQISRVAQELHNACSTFGFFYLTGHGISTQVQDDLVSQSKKFFQLPEKEKMALRLSSGGLAWRGYMPLYGEQTHGKPDMKEGLYLGPEHPDDHPKVKSSTPIHGKNQFPDSLPGLRPAALKYMDQVTQVGQNLMQVMSVSLGLDPQYIYDHLTQDPIIIFRLWNYLPSPQKKAVGIDEHTDYGLITILKQDAPGLQFHSPKYGWIDVPVVPNTLVCSVGDLLDRITAGRYKSRAHRVLVTEPRLSFPCFFDPRWEAPVKELPLDHLPLGDVEDVQARWEKTAYKTLTGNYWQYLAKKLSKVIPQLKDYKFDAARESSTRFHIKIDENKK